MIINRRNFFKAVLALPIGASLAHYEALAAPALNQIKIMSIEAIRLKTGLGLTRIKTDAGITGYGPLGGDTASAKAVIDAMEKGRLPHLGLIGKDPLAIQVHFHNMFYAYPQRARNVRILSGIDIALWDLAGKIFDLPVSKLLGGNFGMNYLCILTARVEIS